MITYFRTAALGAASLLAISWSPTAEGQVVRVRGRGVIVNAPGVAVRVGPVGIPRGLYAVPRRVLIAPPYGALPGGALPGIIALRRQALAEARQENVSPLPAAAELAAMEDAALLNATIGLTTQLDADLGRFTTAAGWRKHLRLPDDALPPPDGGQVTLGFGSLQRTLDRFDAISANSTYSQIHGLPSFVASHAALAEVVGRFAARQAPPATTPPPSATPPAAAAVEPAAGGSEELPTPPPTLAPPLNAGSGERSVLSP